MDHQWSRASEASWKGGRKGEGCTVRAICGVDGAISGQEGGFPSGVEERSTAGLEGLADWCTSAKSLEEEEEKKT